MLNPSYYCSHEFLDLWHTLTPEAGSSYANKADTQPVKQTFRFSDVWVPTVSTASPFTEKWRDRLISGTQHDAWRAAWLYCGGFYYCPHLRFLLYLFPASPPHP